MKPKIPNHISAKELLDWFQKDLPMPTLIDVREQNELLLAPFPYPVVHLPLSQASFWLESIVERVPVGKPVIVICHAGIRSWNFGKWLIDQDLGYEVWNLQGCIDAWSEDVDSSVPRY